MQCELTRRYLELEWELEEQCELDVRMRCTQEVPCEYGEL
jgi:hypothetical protein